jgi:glycosyltransferase involved in cell wall biosynthesis
VASLSEHGLDQHVVVLRSDEADGVSFAAETTAWRDGRSRLPGLRVSPTTLRALRGLAREFHPDLIQAHGGEALKYVALATRADRPSIVYRRIGSTPPWVGGKTRRRAHAALMRRAVRVVTLSDSLRRQTIAAYGLDPERVVTIPRGVDPRRISPVKGRDATRSELSIPASAKVILSLGALTREKDPLAHVEIANRVFMQRDDTMLVVAGDGPLRAELETDVARRGIQERVRVLGNRPDVGDLLAASDVMILASATEGMPGCLIEAGLAGVAAAAYAVGAVSEVIHSGSTGLVVPPGEKDALTRAVLSLLTDDEIRGAMSRAARARCLERYDTRRIVPRYLDLYREVTHRDLASTRAR